MGDQIRIDIANKEDLDHSRLHGKPEIVVEVFEDDAGSVTGDPHDSNLFHVDIDGSNVENLRWGTFD